MDTAQTSFRFRLAIPCFALLAGLVAVPSTANAQIRSKKPDRGVYRSPTLQSVTVERAAAGKSQPGKSQTTRAGVAEFIRQQDPSETRKPKRRDLVEVTLEEGEDLHSPSVERASAERASVEESRTNNDDSFGIDSRRDNRLRDPEPPVDNEASPLRQVGHEDVILAQPSPPRVVGEETVVYSDDTWDEGWHGGHVLHDGTCDGCPSCDGCDAIGCDSMGCSSGSWCDDWAKAFCLDPDRCFGRIELMLMFRKGDRMPPLVTTGPDTDPDTAGQIGETGTQVLAGGDSILKDMTAGGRITLGTWIDNSECRSLVLRGWFAGKESYGFNANQDQIPVIARPFFNVDEAPPENDAFLIAFPGRATGSVSVCASSDVFGGDISVRQFWYGDFGGSVDIFYGYQYMRLNEDLHISSTSTSLDEDFAPVGSVISVADSFDTENEFHGGQLGLASRYRERCWTFNALAKVAFGSLRRRASLAGSTFTSNNGANAVTPEGLLVRSTNSGTITDHTFGWVPELDLSLGWRKYPCFDVTVGYHIIAMTDALQVSGAIDPDLAVSTDPIDPQSPTAALAYDTFYVQGIHFGLQYNY